MLDIQSQKLPDMGIILVMDTNKFEMLVSGLQIHSLRPMLDSWESGIAT